jgi:hypothetical protein
VILASVALARQSTARSRAAANLAFPRGESPSIVAYSGAEHTRDERDFFQTISFPVDEIHPGQFVNFELG